MKTFRALSVIAVIISISVIGIGQTLGQKGYGGSVGGGLILGASNGASYKNPSLGGFFRVYYSNGRFDFRNTLALIHDQKVFEPNGMTVSDRVLAGVLIGKYIRPIGGLEFISHSNVDYTKTGVAPGAGVMFVMKSDDGRTVAEPYIIYFIADSSPNKVQRLNGGVEITHRLKQKLQFFVGAEVVRQVFDQPFAGPEVIHGLTSVGFKFRVGVALPFGKSH